MDAFAAGWLNIVKRNDLARPSLATDGPEPVPTERERRLSVALMAVLSLNLFLLSSLVSFCLLVFYNS